MMTFPHISLASKSPRRKELLNTAQIPFTSIDIDYNEEYPTDTNIKEVAEYLAIQKSKVAADKYSDKLILTADSIIIHEDRILGKPKTPHEAIEFLHLLSNYTHEVHTAICLYENKSRISRCYQTKVTFAPIPEKEIFTYIQSLLPYDKAGGYGIQDWLGMRYVTSIQGSFYTVMGLPVYGVIDCLKELGY